MDESHNTKCDKSSFVNGIKERLEKLEKEKNITNFEREKGIKLEKDIKKGIKLEVEKSINNGGRERGISLEPLSGGKAVEQCSGHDDEHEGVVEDEVVIRSSSRTSVKRKNAFLRKLEIDIAETSHTLVPNGVESLNHHTSDPLLHSVSNIDSGVYSPLNRSDSSVQVFHETPPPLPSRPPPPRKPPRTFLHDTYMDSRRGSTVEQPDYGLVPFLPEDSGYREVMKFFGPNASHEEHIYEEILLEDGEPDMIRAHVNLKRTNEVPMPPPRRRHALRDTRRKRDLNSGYTRCCDHSEILHEVTKCHGLPLQERLSLLTSLCASTLPPPGGLLSLPVPSLEFKREVDWKRSELGLDFLFEKLSGNSRMLLDIFSSVLSERTVILVGESVSEVSLAVQGLINSIYPLKWQYTLVSILPTSMTCMTDAPVPFIMGLLVTNEGIVPPERGMIINIDSATVLYSTGDEATNLPKSARKQLLAGLRCCKGNLKPGTYPAKMAFLAEIFLDTMVALIGHYGKSLVKKDDGTVEFNDRWKRSFVRNVLTVSIVSACMMCQRRI